MQRLFFHSPFSIDSVEILKTLDGDVKVYDVFGKDKDTIPSDIKITSLPYLVDKQLTIESPGPYSVGVITFNLGCRNYLGEPVPDRQRFNVFINDERYDITSDNGLIELEIECGSPAEISIKAIGYSYLPFYANIEVI